VPLAHVVREFQQGESPEAIRSHYPTLSLEQVYGAIAFYLGNKQEVEADLTERKRVENEFSKGHPAPSELKEKLEGARRPFSGNCQSQRSNSASASATA
jgi:hypothetical protein